MTMMIPASGLLPCLFGSRHGLHAWLEGDVTPPREGESSAFAVRAADIIPCSL